MSAVNLLDPTDVQGLIVRLGTALLTGAVIGWERETREKPAGLRTHMLVSFGAAIFVLTSLQTGAVQASADVLSRVIQGIVTGIGFLGAGEIFEKSRSDSNEIRVRGLTSAAAIWVSASLGIAAGCGLWQMAIVSALVTFVILWGVKRLE